jgi:hypothetical protein
MSAEGGRRREEGGMPTSKTNVKKNNNQCKNKYQIPFF